MLTPSQIPPEEIFEETPDEPLFTINERKSLYNTDFSVRLTEQELNAYRVQVVVCLKFNPQQRSVNLMYNPERSMYARYTAWSQDVGVVRDGLIQYPCQIIMDYRNEGMLTRWYRTFINLELASGTNFAIAAVVDSLASTPLQVANYTTKVAEYILETQQRLQGAGLSEAGTPQSPFKFVLPGFAPPETLWKFVSDIPETWYEVNIKTWNLPQIDWLQIAPPSANEEEPNSDPDSENGEGSRPSQGDPPAPSEETPRDPRNNPDDYATAPELNPEPVVPTGPFFVQYRDAQVRDRGSGIVSGGNLNATGCFYGNNIAPQIVTFDTSQQNGQVQWTIDGQGTQGQFVRVNIGSVSVVGNEILSPPSIVAFTPC